MTDTTKPDLTGASIAIAIAPEPWSVWANPYNGFLVWHEPTGKWLPVANDMADALDPGHPAAQNLHRLSAQPVTAEPTTADPELKQRLDAATQHLTNLAVQTAIACATCLHEERTGTRPGHNLANTIIDGTAHCNEHLDTANGRLVPRKSSGLIIAGG